MEAKEKAKDLVDKFTDAIFRNKSIKDTGVLDEVQLRAKQCAIICCQTLIDSWSEDDGAHFAATARYWEEVKTEIQKL